MKAWETVNTELDAYGADLSGKPQLVGLNKVDLLEPERVADLTAALTEAGAVRVLPLSGATGAGVEPVLDALLERIARTIAAPQEIDEWRP